MKNLIVLLFVLVLGANISCSKEELIDCSTKSTVVNIFADNVDNIVITASIEEYIVNKYTDRVAVSTVTNSWLFIENIGSTELNILVGDSSWILEAGEKLSVPVSCYYGF